MTCFLFSGQNNSQVPQQYNLRSSPDTSSSFDFYPNIITNNIPASDNNLAPESSNILPNKSDSGVEGATSSLDTPIPVITTPEEENNYSNNNIIYTNCNSQKSNNSLSNTYAASSSPKQNQNQNKSSRGKYYNNNRGNINRRGSFNRRWRGPGYSSDYQPSPITENNSSPGRGSEYNARYKQTVKVTNHTKPHFSKINTNFNFY